MGSITQSVEVDVDLSTAYNQWTQFETFPQFMEGVEDVKQLTETTLHWVTKIGPVVREFDAVITEQVPDEIIAWESIDGPQHAGRVTFRRLDDGATEVTAEMTIDPEGFVENVGDKAGIIDMRVAGDLMRFKSFIERQGAETGAWRGTVEGSGAARGSGFDPSSVDNDDTRFKGETVGMGEAMPVSPMVSDPETQHPSASVADDDADHRRDAGAPFANRTREDNE